MFSGIGRSISGWKYRRSSGLARHIEYLELAADPAFQDVFVDELEFPSEEED